MVTYIPRGGGTFYQGGASVFLLSHTYSLSAGVKEYSLKPKLIHSAVKPKLVKFFSVVLFYFNMLHYIERTNHNAAL